MAAYERPMIRLEQFKTQHELARNFYDDYDFCPLLCSDDVIEHRQRIQQRISPQSSPSTSPASGSHTRAIPIIDPAKRTQVSVPNSKLASWPGLPSSSNSNSNRAAKMRTSRAIRIIDPTSGHPVTGGYDHHYHHQQALHHHQALQPTFDYYDVSVR
ncbi:hypothetical protein BDB00DRAFT_785656 [Zychaea mexicana]|uniref:uncharacterized protein n=1 Tax=Zychaea mexicana TaxID=64656 RepID=UPI0022FEE77A|nr:uncharacterized protein BDB00DRAFT_785656 [Zychaea mexicana]KAI9496215.1 hypothetical protein BDB00DRAFT_785656 [Zychaea mexicana]